MLSRNGYESLKLQLEFVGNLFCISLLVIHRWGEDSVFGGCNSILENEVLLHLIVIIISLHAGEEIQFPYG